MRPFAMIREMFGCREPGSTGILSIDLPFGSRLKDLLEVLELGSAAGVVAVSKGMVLRKESHLDEGQGGGFWDEKSIGSQ